jgi:hypothetical protein
MPPNATPRPLPSAVVRRREGGVLHREGQYRAKLAYVYFEDEPGRRSAASLLSRDEARRIRSQHRQAAGFAAQAHALFADGRAFQHEQLHSTIIGSEPGTASSERVGGHGCLKAARIP